MAKYNKEDPSTIQQMFDSIADNYDKANAVLSLYLHKRWNRQLVRQVLAHPRTHSFLDLCCGTGDIALDYLGQVQGGCHAYLVDFCSNMLTCAQRKLTTLSQKHQINYVKADVQDLPFANRSMDCATMAYGIRNVKDPAQSMREVYRVLKPGGYFGLLELTQPQNKILKWGHCFYLKALLPVLGKWLTSNEAAYQYLQNSIQTFIPPHELEEMLKDSHFVDTKCISLAGGVATIYLGRKG